MNAWGGISLCSCGCRLFGPKPARAAFTIEDLVDGFAANRPDKLVLNI